MTADGKHRLLQQWTHKAFSRCTYWYPKTSAHFDPEPMAYAVVIVLIWSPKLPLPFAHILYNPLPLRMDGSVNVSDFISMIKLLYMTETKEFCWHNSERVRRETILDGPDLIRQELPKGTEIWSKRDYPAGFGEASLCVVRGPLSLRVTSGLQPARKEEYQSYNHMQVNFANLNELRRSHAPNKNTVPDDT